MEAPIPDENVPGWKYLDIFVFANGQENFPPRKYHLVSDHLDLWPDTLKAIAQEQFGSPDNNINLYTTQGRLIKTPLELNHNKAYVAVRSPEEYIDAGYDRYLLKATRSWEKRQDKRFVSTAENQGEDLMTGKSDRESITALKTIVPSTVEKLDSVIVKPRDRNNSFSAKTTPKRSSLSKKNYNSLSTVKSVRTPTQRRETIDETADESTPSKSQFKGRVHVLQKKRNSDAVVSKVEEVVNQLENSSPRHSEQTNARTKRDESRSRMTKPVENEKDHQSKPKTIPHLNGNRPRILMTKPVGNENDQQRAKVKPFSNSIENRNRNAIESGELVKIEQTKIMPHLNEDQSDSEMVDAEQHIKENKHNSRDKSANHSKAESYLNKNNDDPLKKKETPPATSTVKNNLSKGIINMRIEVFSSEVTRNASCEIKAPLIIVTNDIGSQVDMAGQPGQNKGLHQVIASDKDGIEGNYKVILVKSSYPNNSTSESSKYSVIGECVMFLPVIKLDELFCRCSGGETNDCLGKNSSDINPLKKSASCMSIHKENANRVSIDPDIHHAEIRHDSKGQNLNDDIIQDKTEPLEQKLSTNDKQFEESTKTLEDSPSKLVESVKNFKNRILNRNSENTNYISELEVPPTYTLDSKKDEREKEYSVSQPDYREPVDSEEAKSKQIKTLAQPETKESKISKFSERQVPRHSDLEKVKETNQIKMPATPPEAKESKLSKFSEHQVPIASDLEKDKETNQIKMPATPPEAKESKLSKFSERHVPIASDLEKDKETNHIKMPATPPEAKESKLSKFSERQVPIASDLEKDKETNQIKMPATPPEAKESKLSKFSERQVPIASDFEKVKETNQIKMPATPPEAKESKLSKFSERQVPIASDFEKVKETETEESVEISHSKRSSVELSKNPSETSLVSKRTGIRESEESTLQFDSEKLTKPSAVAEATSLLDTRLEPTDQQAFKDKATQTEWTDMLWEAQLQEDGHYSFRLPTLSRLKEYNL